MQQRLRADERLKKLTEFEEEVKTKTETSKEASPSWASVVRIRPTGLKTSKRSL